VVVLCSVIRTEGGTQWFVRARVACLNAAGAGQKTMLQHGQWTVQFADGTYSGDLRGGQPHGRGKFMRHDRAGYEGEWSEGKMDGRDTYTYPG